jgi:anti-sigma factor RsiW
MMKCKMRKQLSAYQVGLLDPTRAAAVEHHLHGCEACRHELRALQHAADLLQPARVVSPPAELWPAIRAQLKPRSRTAPARTWRPALAAALVLMVLVGVLTLTPLVHHGALPLAPAGEAVAYDQVQLAAAWDTPLADRSALGLAMLAVMDEPPPSQGVMD